MTSGDDDLLMADLRRVAASADPMPRHVDESARAVLATRRLGEELAALLTDSALQAELVRSTDDVRLLYFESPHVSLELEVEPESGHGVGVKGLVTGATGDAVVESAGTRRLAAIAPEGWFSVAGLPRGAT